MPKYIDAEKFLSELKRAREIALDFKKEDGVSQIYCCAVNTALFAVIKSVERSIVIDNSGVENGY